MIFDWNIAISSVLSSSTVVLKHSLGLVNNCLAVTWQNVIESNSLILIHELCNQKHFCLQLNFPSCSPAKSLLNDNRNEPLCLNILHNGMRFTKFLLKLLKTLSCNIFNINSFIFSFQQTPFFTKLKRRTSVSLVTKSMRICFTSFGSAVKSNFFGTI